MDKILGIIAGIEDGSVVETVEDAPVAPSTTKLRKMFLHYQNNCADHRNDAFRDRRYYDGDQISKAWRSHLEANDMPMVPINLIKDNITAHVGLVASQQSDVRAFARTQAGAPAAETATKLMRYAIEAAQVEPKFRDHSAQFFIEGIAAFLIECDNENIYLDPIDFRDFIYDPNSRRGDFSDAKWLGFSRWLPASDIEESYPDAFLRISPTRDNAIFYDLDASNGFGKDTDDTADNWINGQKMLRVIEMYYLEGGQWQNVVWCHAGVLDFGPSQYTTDKGVSLCPIVAEACHTMGDPESKNQRYGQVRDLIYPQDDYNARRHAALKYMMSKTIQMVDPNAQPVDAETLRAEVRKREAIIPPGYQVQDTSVSDEQVQFMQMAGAEIQRLSPSAAVTGTNLPDDASGRSRQIAAAGGRLSLTPVLGRIQDLRENIYRHVWYRINQYWHAQMEVRVSGDVNAPKYMQINTPVIEEVAEPIPDPQTGQPMFDPYTGEPATQMVPKVVGVHNEVATMDMDFKVTTVEQHNNLEQETWEALMQLMSSLQVAPGTKEFRAALDWAPIPNKTEVIERYDAQMARMAEEEAPAQQMAQQIAQMQQQIEMLVNKSKADKDAASAESNAAKAERTRLETAMLADNHNTQQEVQEIIKQQLFR